jgi:tetratricopeptide (TPR) repeat protein
MAIQSVVVLAIIALTGELPGSGAQSPDPETWPRMSLNEARRIASAVEDPFRRAQILEQTAAVAIGLGDAATACTLLVDAFEVARAIADRSLRDLALRNIAVNQTLCGDVSAALASVTGIWERDLRDAVHGAVVEALVRAGQLDSARSVAHELDAALARSQALRQIAIAYAREERFAQARALADAIPDDMLQALAMADIAAFHAVVGNEQALNTARAIARRIRPTAQREAALGYVAAIQAQSGDLQGALETAGGIKGPATRAYALARIAGVLQRADDTARAAELLDRAFALSRTARTGETKVIVLCEIAETYLLLSDPAAAVTALDAAFSSAKTIGQAHRDSTLLEIIARTQARAGALSKALETAEHVPSGSARALVVHDILAARAEAGGAAEAIAIARSFGDPQLRIAGLFGIVGAQTAGGDSAGANQTLELILDAARSAEDPDYRAHSLGAVAAAEVRLGDTADGWPIFQEALAEAATLADPYARALAHVNLSDPFTQR